MLLMVGASNRYMVKIVQSCFMSVPSESSRKKIALFSRKFKFLVSPNSPHLMGHTKVGIALAGVPQNSYS